MDTNEVSPVGDVPVEFPRGTENDQRGHQAPTAVDASPFSAGDGKEKHAGAPVSVLIVEDFDDSRTVLHRLLSLDGHDVREAADGHQGLAALLSNPPDVALVDVGLPGIDGYEVARIARKNPALSRVRLVALTGYGRPEDRKALLDAGFDEHLVKPVHLDELERVLKPRANVGKPEYSPAIGEREASASR